MDHAGVRGCGAAPALVILLTASAGADPATRAFLGGLLLGAALGAAAQLPFVARAEHLDGGALLYQRLPWRDSLWSTDTPLSRGTVYLVDDPDPDRWGEHRR